MSEVQWILIYIYPNFGYMYIVKLCLFLHNVTVQFSKALKQDGDSKNGFDHFNSKIIWKIPTLFFEFTFKRNKESSLNSWVVFFASNGPYRVLLAIGFWVSTATSCPGRSIAHMDCGRVRRAL